MCELLKTVFKVTHDLRSLDLNVNVMSRSTPLCDAGDG